MAYKKHHMSRRKSRRKQSKRNKRTKSKTRKLKGGNEIEDKLNALPYRELQLLAKNFDHIAGNEKKDKLVKNLSHEFEGVEQIIAALARAKAMHSVSSSHLTAAASAASASSSSFNVSRADYGDGVPVDIMDALFENYLTDVAGIIETGTAIRRSGRERGRSAIQRQQEDNDRLIALVDDKKKQAMKQKLEKALAKGTITQGEDGIIVILDDDAYKGKIGRKFVWIRKSDGLPPNFSKADLERHKQDLLQGLRDKVALGDTEYDPNYDLSNKVNTAIRAYIDRLPTGTLGKMSRQEFVNKITHELARTVSAQGDTRFVDQPSQNIWPATLNAMIESTIDQLLTNPGKKFRKDS